MTENKLLEKRLLKKSSFKRLPDVSTRSCQGFYQLEGWSSAEEICFIFLWGMRRDAEKAGCVWRDVKMTGFFYRSKPYLFFFLKPHILPQLNHLGTNTGEYEVVEENVGDHKLWYQNPDSSDYYL